MPDTDPLSDIAGIAAPPKRQRGGYDDLIERHGADNKVDPNLIRAIMGVESGGNPRARSPKNAQGLMQLIPETAARFGTTDIYDPDQNIRGGARYLRFLQDRFKGDIDKTLAGYNAGEGAVDKFGGIPPYKETRAYVPAVKSRYQKLGGQVQQQRDPLGSVASPSKATEIDPLTALVSGQTPQTTTTPRQSEVRPVPTVSGRGAAMARMAQVKPGGRRGTSNRPLEVGSSAPEVPRAFSARTPSTWETIKEAVGPYVPGLTSIDTPAGIKTDAPRGAVRGLTLGAVDASREITPEELALRPQAKEDQAMREFVGETSTAFIPYIGAAKVAGKIPALAKAGRAAAAGRTALTFGGVETARQGINAVKTGDAIDPKEIAISTAIGTAMGAIPGVNAGLKQRLFAAVAPQVTADMARGVPLEQAAQNAITNVLFEAGAGRKLGLSKERIGELRKQIEARQTVPTETQRRLNEGQVETKPNVSTQPEAVESAAIAAETVPVRPVVDRGNAEVVPVLGSMSGSPRRWQHTDFGEVTEAPNQKRLGKGRVRVVAEDGSEHVIKKAALTGAGNQRAIPIKPEPVEQGVEVPKGPASESVLDKALNDFGEVASVAKAIKQSKYKDAFLKELGAGAEALEPGHQRPPKFRTASGDIVTLRGAYKEKATYGDDIGGFIVERERAKSDSTKVLLGQVFERMQKENPLATKQFIAGTETPAKPEARDQAKQKILSRLDEIDAQDAARSEAAKPIETKPAEQPTEPLPTEVAQPVRAETTASTPGQWRVTNSDLGRFDTPEAAATALLNDKGQRGAVDVNPRKAEYERASTPILKDVERATMGRPERPSLTQYAGRAKSYLQRALVAEFTPLRELEATLYGRHNVPVVNLARKFEQVAGAPAKAQADIFDFKRNVIEPIKRSADDFNSYLFLKRVKDRLNNDPERKRVADWTYEKANDGLKELKTKVGPETYKRLEEAGSVYQKEMDKALALQVESGRMSPELYSAIKESNDFYAPFKVLRYIEDSDIVRGSGRRVATTQALAKKITGIDSEDFQLGNILQASAEQIVRSRVLAEKNLKMLELDKLADLDTEGSLIKRIEDDARPRQGFEFVRFLKNGEPVTLEVESKVADAVQGLNPKQAGLLTQAMMLARRPLQLGATSANAGFQAVNLFFADLPRSALVSRYGIRTVKDAYQFPMDWAYSLMTSMKGNFGKPNQLYMDWLRSGAANSTIQKELTPEAFRPSLGIAKPGVKNLAKSTIDSVAKFSNAIEETSKILGLKRGMKIEQIAKMNPVERQAAMEKIAAEVRNYSGSPDFARKGSETRDLNLLFMFFNARLQGVTSDISRLTGKTGTKEGVVAWARLGTVLGLPTTYLALLNQSEGYKEDYDKIPDWEKKSYWMIPRESYFTTEDGERIRDYWRVPKRELGQIIGNTIESAVDFSLKRDPKAGKEWAVGMLENLSPVNIQGRTMGERAESLFGSTNPALKLPAEAVMNRDTFRHRPIVPEYMQGAEPSEQYRATTPRSYVRAGRALNVSPLQLEHAAEGFTGGALGQFSVRPPLPGRSPLTQYPIAKRFVRSGAIAEDTGARDKIGALERLETTDQVKRRRQAIETLQSWSGLSALEKANRLSALKQSDPKLAEKVKTQQEELEKGITYLDKQVKALGVMSGAREAFIQSELAKRSPAERELYLAEMEKKGLLPKKSSRPSRSSSERESRPSRQ